MSEVLHEIRALRNELDIAQETNARQSKLLEDQAREIKRLNERTNDQKLVIMHKTSKFYIFITSVPVFINTIRSIITELKKTPPLVLLKLLNSCMEYHLL